MKRSRFLPRRGALPFLLALVLTSAGCEQFCRSEPPPPPPVPTLKGADGREYILLAKGVNKPFFDAKGLLERVEYDRNADGKPDQIARHDGKRIPELIENDDDFDGNTDTWLYFNPAGVLLKQGGSRRGGKPDVWVFTGPDGKPIRQEYDEDGDGNVDRIERLKGALIDVIEVDADRNGKVDRWQRWDAGRLQYEDLDSDGDGKPDRRLRYGARGEVTKMEPLNQP
jgi:hypothetical protein